MIDQHAAPVIPQNIPDPAQPSTPSPSFVSASVPPQQRHTVFTFLLPALFGLVIIGLLSAIFFRASSSNTPHLITIQGRSSMKAEAGTATIVWQYAATGLEQSVVRAESDQVVSQLLSSLSSIAGSTTEVSAAQIGPTARTPLTQQLTYEYRKTFKTTLSELSTLGSAYSLLTNPNITLVQTTFSPKNEDLIQAELMKTALENAKEKATAAVSASGKGIGSLVNVTEVVTNREQANVLLTSNPETNISAEPKDVEVTVNLNATFELK